MVVVATRYPLGSSYALKRPHLEGEEVSRPKKQCTNLPLGSKGDSHKNDRVNFFHP
jgi:hypothetical protein